MATIKELQEQRLKAVNDAQALVTRAQGEKREMTSEENEKFDLFMGDADRLKGEIDTALAGERRTARLSEAQEELRRNPGRRTEGGDPSTEARGRGGAATEHRWTPRLAGGRERVVRFSGQGRGSNDYDRSFRDWVSSPGQYPERRGLVADSAADGGFLYASEQFVAQLIQAVDDAVFIRQLASVISVGAADSLGAPSLDTDPSDPDWTSELQTGADDTAIKFGKRELKPTALAKGIRISRKLLRKAPSADAIVLERLAYKFGVAQERAFLLGSGASQPLGVFTASAMGITTARDISTDNTTTAVTWDGLMNAKYALKAAYHNRPSTYWIFHRDGVRNIRKIKDGQGQFIWRPAGLPGTPDMVLDIPYLMSEFAPNTFTTGLYVGILGDFSKYIIADALTMEIQRLEELYARTNELGYIGRLETDGMPALEEAFVRVKLA